VSEIEIQGGVGFCSFGNQAEVIQPQDGEALKQATQMIDGGPSNLL